MYLEDTPAILWCTLFQRPLARVWALTGCQPVQATEAPPPPPPQWGHTRMVTASPERAWPASASTADSVAGEILGEHSQREVHISRGFGLQPEAVDGLRDHLLVL